MLMAQTIKTVLDLQPSRLIKQLNGLVRLSSSFSTKDLTKQSTDTDFLMANLRNATNARRVLDVVSSHNNIMNNKHVIQALRSLFMLQKQGSSDWSTRDILKHPDFSKLCARLKQQAGTIELNETIEALKVVSYVGVPSDSVIMQVLLQLIKHNINSMSLPQIMFVTFIINQFKKTPLVEALKIALPLVFEVHLSLKMDRNDPAHLAEYLQFAASTKLSEKTLAQITNSLMTFNDTDLNSKVAKSIIWSICDLPTYDFLIPLLKMSIKSLILNIDDLGFNDMETTLTKLITRYKKKAAPHFYNEVFFDTCANYVIDNDLGFKYSIYMLRKFFKVRHVNNYLLDYMSKKVQANPELILEGNAVDIYIIVNSIALTEYRPANWENLKTLLEQVQGLASCNRKEIIWIRFASSLCSLNIFKEDVLNKVLQETYLDSLFRQKYKSDIEDYITIWQCIKSFRPDLNCLLPSRFIAHDILKRNFTDLEFPLESALQKSFGGQKYIKTGIFSHLGHFIDHVIVFRKGGFAVASNWENVNLIEDFVLPPDYQMIAIMCLNSIQYPINKKIMNYSTQLSINLLESKGIPVVPICIEVWESLAEHEKVPYLMQAIREKIDINMQISESVM